MHYRALQITMLEKKAWKMRGMEIWLKAVVGGWGGWECCGGTKGGGWKATMRRAAPQLQRSGDRLRIGTKCSRGDREASRCFMGRRKVHGWEYRQVRGRGRRRRWVSSGRNSQVSCTSTHVQCACGQAALSSSTGNCKLLIREPALAISSF